MKLIDGVFELSSKFMNNPNYVMLNLENMEALANRMLETGIKPFPSELSDQNLHLMVWKELAASAINYCYWYGKSTVRPNNVDSTIMYQLVDEAFGLRWDNFDLQLSINVLGRLLTRNRFPLVEERIRHLQELRNSSVLVGDIIQYEGNLSYSIFEDLVIAFPGFGSDMFLKRASLFFLQLYRSLGWFEDAMQWLPVPADYQVPKMLRHFGCIVYLDPVRTMVANGELIPSGSAWECEIRAATILVGRFLMERTKWNVSDVDSWLWLQRGESKDPFHLTITTDY